jgi:hypothetical protein
MALKDDVMLLFKSLFPKGRAFKMPANSYFEALMKGLSESYMQAYLDTNSILDSIIPDNDNFTVEDAADWERRLGLITNENVSLDDRKLAILRKMAFPGNIKARQHQLYIQGQLQKAGFDVYVYENKFDDGAGGFDKYSPSQMGSFPHGPFNHGQYNHGAFGITKCVNHIDEQLDQQHVIPSNLIGTFYIGSANIGTVNYPGGIVSHSLPLADPNDLFVDIDANRKDEFRRLILTLKPAEASGLLFVNYV